MRLRLLCSVVLLTAALPSAKAGLIGPSPYLSFADSPFNPASFSYFHLEDFETHALTVPGVSASAGGVTTSFGFTGSIIDSVDGDDGSIDGTCNKSPLNCDSWFANGATGVSWTFNAGVLGSLPTAAGIVWTDGSGTVTFQAYDQNNVLLGELTYTGADGNFFGGTAEDRFFGVTNAGGISKIFLSNTTGGIEMDHLQYGGGAPSGVPEPASLILVAAGLTGLVVLRRRRVPGTR